MNGSEGAAPVLAPSVDDRYWFDFSKSLLDGAISRRETAAETLQRAVIWLWGVYTAVASVGFALSGKDITLGATILVAFPSGVLILVYWGTVWVQMPATVGFDPRSPDEIEQAHIRIVKSKDRRLILTLVLSVVAALAVSVGLIVASVSRAPSFKAPMFNAALISREAKREVTLMAYVGAAAKAELRITPLGVSSTSFKPTDTVLLATPGGLIQSAVELPEPAEEALVELEWDAGDGLRVEVSRRVTASTK